MPAKSPPPGYHTVTPAIVVRDAAKAIEFYRNAFGAEEIARMKGPDGGIMHAEIKIGDSLIMLGDENPQWNVKSPLSTGGPTGSLHIYVDDADRAFDQAIRAGATVHAPMEDSFWGDRYGQVLDPFGHRWGIATRVRNLTPEEQQRAGEEWMAKHAQGAGA